MFSKLYFSDKTFKRSVSETDDYHSDFLLLRKFSEHNAFAKVHIIMMILAWQRKASGHNPNPCSKATSDDMGIDEMLQEANSYDNDRLIDIEKLIEDEDVQNELVKYSKQDIEKLLSELNSDCLHMGYSLDAKQLMKTIQSEHPEVKYSEAFVDKMNSISVIHNDLDYYGERLKSWIVGVQERLRSSDFKEWVKDSVIKKDSPILPPIPEGNVILKLWQSLIPLLKAGKNEIALSLAKEYLTRSKEYPETQMRIMWYIQQDIDMKKADEMLREARRDQPEFYWTNFKKLPASLLIQTEIADALAKLSQWTLAKAWLADPYAAGSEKAIYVMGVVKRAEGVDDCVSEWKRSADMGFGPAKLTWGIYLLGKNKKSDAEPKRLIDEVIKENNPYLLYLLAESLFDMRSNFSLFDNPGELILDLITKASEQGYFKAQFVHALLLLSNKSSTIEVIYPTNVMDVNAFFKTYPSIADRFKDSTPDYPRIRTMLEKCVRRGYNFAKQVLDQLPKESKQEKRQRESAEAAARAKVLKQEAGQRIKELEKKEQEVQQRIKELEEKERAKEIELAKAKEREAKTLEVRNILKSIVTKVVETRVPEKPATIPEAKNPHENPITEKPKEQYSTGKMLSRHLTPACAVGHAAPQDVKKPQTALVVDEKLMQENPEVIFTYLYDAAYKNYDVSKTTLSSIKKYVKNLLDIPPVKRLEKITEGLTRGNAVAYFNLLLKWSVFDTLFPPQSKQSVANRVHNVEWIATRMKDIDQYIKEGRKVSRTFIQAILIAKESKIQHVKHKRILYVAISDEKITAENINRRIIIKDRGIRRMFWRESNRDVNDVAKEYGIPVIEGFTGEIDRQSRRRLAFFEDHQLLTDDMPEVLECGGSRHTQNI